MCVNLCVHTIKMQRCRKHVWTRLACHLPELDMKKNFVFTLILTRKCSVAAESHIRSHQHISSKIQLQQRSRGQFPNPKIWG